MVVNRETVGVEFNNTLETFLEGEHTIQML